MIITNQIRLSRILNLTWKIDILLLASCILAYEADNLVIFQYFKIPSFIPSVMGTALAFFIGFNSNQAYDRWWEARRVMGAIVNDSRSWARGLLNYCLEKPNDDNLLEKVRKRMIFRHIAFLYAFKSSLRGKSEDYNHYISDQ